jgi:hypothetical protein
MVDIPLGRADYHRAVPKEARVLTRNRYFEQNPVLSEKLTALIARPGLKRWIAVGEGPIRNRVYSQPGSFDEALFVVSGNGWWRVETDGETTNLTNSINPGGAGVSMAATGTIGETPEYLFMADGRNLWLYVANGYARGSLQGVPANNDTFKVGGTYYKWTNASVDAGTPAGTLADPWLVDLGADALEAFTNAGAALMANGEPGVDYSTALTAQGQVQVAIVSDDTLSIRANTPGVIGNGIATTETGGAIAWGAATLAGGGTDSVSVVQTPDDVGVISVGYIAGYVVVVPAQGEGINGRFWWIEPGETTIDPLNFATAERAPDPIFQVIVFGDQFWLPGSNTTEVWYFTGNIDSPVLRLQGVTFDRGTIEGTAVQVKESMIITDSDGGVFQIAGGLERISNPAIEERIRKAIAYEAAHTI